jgi:hypothetical protein
MNLYEQRDTLAAAIIAKYADFAIVAAKLADIALSTGFRLPGVPEPKVFERARRAVIALREPDASCARVPNTVRQSMADVIEELESEIIRLRSFLSEGEQQRLDSELAWKNPRVDSRGRT